MKERIYKLDTVKALAMLCVLLLHSLNLYQQHKEFLRMLCALLPGCAMFLFSFCSGYVIRPGRWNWHALFRLFLVGIVANCLINFVADTTGVLGKVNYCKVANTLWYFWILLASKLILPCFRKPAWALIISIAVSWLSFLYPHCINVNPIHRFIGFLPFFAFGYWLANDEKAFQIKEYIFSDRHRKIYEVLLPIMIMGMILFVAGSHGNLLSMSIQNSKRFIDVSYSWGGLRCASHLFFAILCIVWLKAVPKEENPLSRLGTRTLVVYLFHLIPILLVRWLTLHYSILANSYCLYPLILLSILCDLCLFHPFFSNLLNRFLKPSRQ